MTSQLSNRRSACEDELLANQRWTRMLPANSSAGGGTCRNTGGGKAPPVFRHCSQSRLGHGAARRVDPATADFRLRVFHLVLFTGPNEEMSEGGDPQRRPGDGRIRNKRAAKHQK